jgi:hypothetical protein
MLIFYFLGVQFIVFGLNGFFPVIRLPEPPEGIARFMQAMKESRYALGSIKIFEIAGGALCLFEKTSPIGLMLLGPIVYHIVGLHWTFNRDKFWVIGLQVLLPFIAACFISMDRFLRLLEM